MNKRQRDGLALMLLGIVYRDVAKSHLVVELDSILALAALLVSWATLLYGTYKFIKD